ncbi:MAG: sigma-70 family RNA polymerase sigma factor [Kofleriaceae bacterium]|nr:sigma-70 family RNA polymerase sigma factor [Kofleriaceae bacterium]
MSEDVEREIRSRCDGGDHNGALTAAIVAYGDEVYSFLVARHRDDDVAADVFSQTTMDLVKSLPTFAWRCSMRTWFYRLARSAAVRYERAPGNRRDRREALSQVSEAVQQVRSRTQVHLRTEMKDGMRRLREQLDEQDQLLLMLRIDRDLGWNEIAEIVEDNDDPAVISRASARLRQQFAKLKTRLRELAVAEGLIPAE